MRSRTASKSQRAKWIHPGWLATLILVASLPAAALAQEQDTSPVSARLAGTRWVGIISDVPTVGLWLEFFSDSMMVLETGNSRLTTYPLDYRATNDSIIAWGDTLVAARYEFVQDRMLLFTPTGLVITMAQQARLGRSFVGLWTGSLETETGDLLPARLQINANGTASWRRVSGGVTQVGEWDRSVRTVTFMWLPDSTRWIGYHDPDGNAIQFVNTGEGTAGTVFRKAYR